MKTSFVRFQVFTLSQATALIAVRQEERDEEIAVQLISYCLPDSLYFEFVFNHTVVSRVRDPQR